MLNSAEARQLVKEFAQLKEMRNKGKLKNQERLKLFNDEEWRKKFYLTRKLPVFSDDWGIST